ncbi:MAG: hypothetical protein ACKVHO_21560 [Verrucomicrobiia bacterium]|jgi:hypothetical protein
MANEEPIETNSRSAVMLEEFLEDEILKTQAGVRRTRIVGVIMVAAVVGYMTWITTGLTEFLVPKTAAGMTTDFVSAQVASKTDLLADAIKEEVPKLVRSLPDYALGQIPQYRETFEDNVVGNLDFHAQTTSKHLDNLLKAFFKGNEPEIKQFLEATEEEPIGEIFKEEVLAAILDYLRSVPPNGEPITEKFDKSLLVLKQAETKLDYLAVGKDLSPAEKKTRYALAVVGDAIIDQLHALKMQKAVED